MKNNIIGLVAIMTVSSCVTVKDYQPQKVTVDNVLRQEVADSLNAADTTALLHWRDFYKDARLQALIEEGLAHNTELETARLRTEEALASLRGARGLLLPSMGITSEGAISSFDGENTQQTYSIGPTIRWEADIAGKQRSAVRGAMATAEGQDAYRQLVQTRLIATIAQSYYTLEMLDAKQQVLQQTINSWDEQIKALRALMDAGEAQSGDISQAEASRYEAQALLEAAHRQTFETEGSLAVLLGRSSGAISRGSFSTDVFSYALASHLPLTALATRPDVRQQEAAVRAAFSQLNVARAAFYPSLSLSGSAGWTNNGLTGITNPGKLLLQALGSLTQPLFANGQNRANLDIAKAQHQEALLAFSQTLLGAGNEVNNALMGYQTCRRQVGLQEKQIAKLREAVRAANAQMEYGDGNALSIIVARQSLLNAEVQQLTCEYEQLESYMLLFRALGGGQ